MTSLDYQQLYRHISAQIEGRIAMPEVEAVVLAETVCDSDLHVEVGTLWGGTAILAALAGAKQVYTIDTMDGGDWRAEQKRIGKSPSMQVLINNLKWFGVEDKVKVIMATSSPPPLPYLRPDTFFIDGDHSYMACKEDWINASKMTQRAIVVHDYGDDFPYRRNVKKAIDEVAMTDRLWRLAKRVETMLVFERIHD